MALQLELRESNTLPIEVDGLVPNLLREMSLAEIERLPVLHGNRLVPAGELFRVAGDPANSQMRWTGKLASVHRIGAKMTAGIVRIEGDAGRHVGAEMHGGEIHVAGSTGDWPGVEMHGGLIHVRGSAGHLAGGTYPGSSRGMTGGTLLVEGNAGDQVGHSMRRGLLAVGGNGGDFLGANMLAGTILVFGRCGLRPGAGMRRGTIGLLGTGPYNLLPTFRPGAQGELPFMPLVLRELARHGFPLDDLTPRASYQIVHGDLVNTGRGEILLRA